MSLLSRKGSAIIHTLHHSILDSCPASLSLTHVLRDARNDVLTTTPPPPCWQFQMLADTDIFGTVCEILCGVLAIPPSSPPVLRLAGSSPPALRQTGSRGW